MDTIEKLAEEYAKKKHGSDYDFVFGDTKTDFIAGYTAANKGVGMKWVKASERLPENNLGNVIFKFLGNAWYGHFENHTGESYLYIPTKVVHYPKSVWENAEWLDESQSPSDQSGEENITPEELRRKICYDKDGSFLGQHKVNEVMEIYADMKVKQLRQGDGVAVGLLEWVDKKTMSGIKVTKELGENLSFKELLTIFKLSPEYKAITELSGQRGFTQEDMRKCWDAAAAFTDTQNGVYYNAPDKENYLQSLTPNPAPGGEK